MSASRRCWNVGRQRGDALDSASASSVATALVEGGTGENGDAVPAFEQVRGLGVERRGVSPTSGLDAGEETRVEQDRVAMGRETRRELGLERVDLIVGDGRARILEHREHPAQQGS